MHLVFGIGMELPAGGPPQAKVPAGIAAELRSLVKRKKPTRCLVLFYTDRIKLQIYRGDGGKEKLTSEEQLLP